MRAAGSWREPDFATTVAPNPTITTCTSVVKSLFSKTTLRRLSGSVNKRQTGLRNFGRTIFGAEARVGRWPHRSRKNIFPGSCLTNRFISKLSKATETAEVGRPLLRITSSMETSSWLNAA